MCYRLSFGLGGWWGGGGGQTSKDELRGPYGAATTPVSAPFPLPRVARRKTYGGGVLVLAGPLGPFFLSFRLFPSLNPARWAGAQTACFKNAICVRTNQRLGSYRGIILFFFLAYSSRCRVKRIDMREKGKSARETETWGYFDPTSSEIEVTLHFSSSPSTCLLNPRFCNSLSTTALHTLTPPLRL